MKPCVNEFSVFTTPAEQFVNICADNGFSAVEFTVANLEQYLIERPAQRMRTLLDDRGLEVANVQPLEFFSLVPAENYAFMLKKAEKMMILAKLVGCRHIGVVPGKNTDNLDFKAVKEITVDRLKRMADLAEQYEVRVCLEAIGLSGYSLQKQTDALEIIKAVGSAWIGLTVDTLHIYGGGTTLEELRSIPTENIFMVHFHDSLNEGKHTLKDEDRIYPGDGLIDLHGIAAVLKEKKYAGPVSVELLNPEIWAQDPRKVVEKIRRALEKYITFD